MRSGRGKPARRKSMRKRAEKTLERKTEESVGGRENRKQQESGTWAALHGPD